MCVVVYLLPFSSIEHMKILIETQPTRDDSTHCFLFLFPINNFEGQYKYKKKNYAERGEEGPILSLCTRALALLATPLNTHISLFNYYQFFFTLLIRYYIYMVYAATSIVRFAFTCPLPPVQLRMSQTALVSPRCDNA